MVLMHMCLAALSEQYAQFLNLPKEARFRYMTHAAVHNIPENGILAPAVSKVPFQQI